ATDQPRLVRRCAAGLDGGCEQRSSRGLGRLSLRELVLERVPALLRGVSAQGRKCTHGGHSLFPGHVDLRRASAASVLGDAIVRVSSWLLVPASAMASI